MKKVVTKLLTFILIACFSSSLFTACNLGDGDQPPTTVSKISSSLLDGKVANFLGAEGFGIIEKTPKTTTVSKINPLTVHAEESKGEQKKTEFVKQTELGYVDVYFHSNNGLHKGYKNLNKKYAKHHHKNVECSDTDCDEISDEITQEEASGNASTIASLNARINKLYNYKNFTFASISSAVEGDVTVVYNVYRPTINQGVLTSLKHSYPTAVNIENHFSVSGSGWEFGYIKIDGTDTTPQGIIPTKINENETGYHTSNYWCDDYNQSYLIDNDTGIVYSLSQFKYIYSVANGIIKVFDDTVPGWFKYYKPVITDEGLTFERILLPTDLGYVSNLPVGGTSTSVMIDVYGNMLFNGVSTLSQNAQVDEYGEQKCGNNIIISYASSQVYNELSNKNQYGNSSQIIATRYLKSNRYHQGSDGRIYRVDFRGLFSEVKVHVLDENCAWAEVDNTTNVTFDKFNGAIAWWVGVNQSYIDSFRITKISGGYAYYSTACASDGAHVWDIVTLSEDLVSNKDYAGVVKIPVNGPTSDYSHLLYMQEFINAEFDYNKNFSIFLIGDTQMLYHDKNTVYIVDLESGKRAQINSSTNALTTIDKNNLVFNINGVTKYLNVLQNVDIDNFESAFSTEPIILGGKLDAYFEFLTK